MPDDKDPKASTMGRPDPGTKRGAGSEPPVYSPTARTFHWLTVILVAGMVPVGLIMTSRAERNVWDGLTNTLYSGHKLTGLLVLLIVLARLTYRFLHGAPPDEPTLEPFHRIASHATHWTIYGLLLTVPLLGWIGVSLYPALDIFGWLKLPALVAPDQPAASTAFLLHKLGAFALVGLATLHIAAALYHYFVRRDGVLQRMLPGIGRGSRT